MDITTGTLDDPDRYPPGDEIWLSQKIGWEELHPAMRKFERSSLNESDGSGPSGEWSDPAAE